MKVSFTNAVTAKSDVLICPVFEYKKEVPKLYDSSLRKYILELKQEKLFSGKNGEIECMNIQSKNLPKRVCFVGLGNKKDLSHVEVRNALANATKKVMHSVVKNISFYLIPELEEYAQVIGEGMMLVNYSLAKYKTGKEAKKAEEKLFTELSVISVDSSNGASKNVKDGFQKAVQLAESICYVRDLVNGPSNIISVEKFAEEAKKIARTNKYGIKIFERPALKKMGMGAFLSVNHGSGSKEAKLVILDYNPKGKSGAKKQAPIAFIGKGVIFDSGGYNLKPTKYIEDMQSDMAGGAVVLGLFKLLNKLKINRRIIGIIPLTENLIDAHAQKPADIVTSYSGKTIEIRNTDAEGRMLLADALAYAVKQYKPEYTIDLATLTGACVVALGSLYAGIMGNDEKLINKLIKSGKETDELLWQLPIHKDFSKDMKGKMADLRNVDDGTSHLAGTSKAAAFLQEFVDKAKWAHIDIAGTAYVTKPKAYESEMGTGFGVRLLASFLEGL